MAGPTTLTIGHPSTVKKWSGQLFLDVSKKSYFDRKFVAETPTTVLQRLTDLEQDAGDTINYDLSVQLRSRPTYGDNRLEGREENLRFFQDKVQIDQIRHGVSAGGKMSRKRTLHNIRKIAKERLSDYFSKLLDEMTFIYLSGDRGINEDYTEEVTWAGHAENPIQAPDDAHIMFGGDATGKGDLDSADGMSKALIERASVHARMMRSKDPETANMMPVMVNGEAHYVLLMSPFQEHTLRTADSAGWLDAQKAAAAAEGRSNPIFKGGLGLINNVVLHSHESVIRFDDYGGGQNQPAARALFLGRQAGVSAYGAAAKGTRYSWSEDTKDHGNEPVISAGIIIGVKKARFNGRDFGVTALDTYAPDPNP